jgi:hypothetical protein
MEQELASTIVTGKPPDRSSMNTKAQHWTELLIVEICQSGAVMISSRRNNEEIHEIMLEVLNQLRIDF